METLGPINGSAVSFLSDGLGRPIAEVSGESREGSFLFQRLSVLIQRFNACDTVFIVCRFVCVFCFFLHRVRIARNAERCNS